MPDGRSIDVIQAAGRMEAAARSLYIALASHPPYEPYLQELFLQLAAEEAEHVLLLGALPLREDVRLWPDEVAVRFTAELDAMSAEIDATRSELLRESDSLRPGRIVQRLGEMEARFHCFHAVKLATSADLVVNRLFASLALQDQSHRDLLQKARKRLGA
ncbi:MAG: hypothetical protein WCK73_17550 [Deltaproteobacteria bacterium]